MGFDLDQGSSVRCAWVQLDGLNQPTHLPHDLAQVRCVLSDHLARFHRPGSGQRLIAGRRSGTSLPTASQVRHMSETIAADAP